MGMVNGEGKGSSQGRRTWWRCEGKIRRVRRARVAEKSAEVQARIGKKEYQLGIKLNFAGNHPIAMVF